MLVKMLNNAKCSNRLTVHLHKTYVEKACLADKKTSVNELTSPTACNVVQFGGGVTCSNNLPFIF